VSVFFVTPPSPEEVCHNALIENIERVEHFKGRMREKGLTSKDAVIVIINGNDGFGEALASTVMPEGWDKEYREQGAIPYARGIMYREALGALIGEVAPEVKEAFDVEDKIVVLIVEAPELVAVFHIDDN
jgi:hypothetical protein